MNRNVEKKKELSLKEVVLHRFNNMKLEAQNKMTRKQMNRGQC